MLGNDIRLYKGTRAWDLALAVQKEDTVKIKELCQKKPSLINFQEKVFDQSLLQWAVYTDHYLSARVLAELGADPNLQSEDGTSAFIEASAKHATSEYVKLLLRYGGNVNAEAHPKDGKNEQQLRTPLVTAAGCNLESTKLLVEAGADINYQNEQYQSPLLSACLMDQIEIVKYLIIDKGADFKKPLLTDLNDKPTYITDLLRDMTFDLNSDEYRLKMEVVTFLKAHGMDYWKTEIPSHLYEHYSKEYLEKY